MKNVNSSSLPAIINSDKISFEKPENTLKFITGPICENPGPIFPKQVMTDEMVVIRSNPLKEMIKEPVNTTNI